jgi:hypothetical protein
VKLVSESLTDALDFAKESFPSSCPGVRRIADTSYDIALVSVPETPATVATTELSPTAFLPAGTMHWIEVSAIQSERSHAVERERAWTVVPRAPKSVP